MTDLILIQPLSGELPYIVPCGALSLFNMVNLPKLGVFEWELTDSMIRETKIIAIPLQWAYSLPSAAKLVFRLKSVNPNIAVIAGGYIVDLFGSKLFEIAPFDYLIVGDAEKTFPALVKNLVDGNLVLGLPNLLARKSQKVVSYTIGSDEFNLLDSLSIDWFPTLLEIARKTQNLSVPTYIYPWLEFTRGCVYDCDDCLGSVKNQRLLAGRERPAVRSQESARDLLESIERKGYKWVYFTSDFITIAGKTWARQVLNRRYMLTAYYECYKLPELDKIEMLTSAFERVILGIFINICQPSSEGQKSWDALIEIADKLGSHERLVVYLTDKVNSLPPAGLNKKFWFKLYRSSEFNSLVPKNLPPLNSLTERLDKQTKRLGLLNRIIGLILKRAPFMFTLLWKISERRALRCAKQGR